VSGIEGDDHYFMLFTFRGAIIVRIDSVRDEREALEAAGLRTHAVAGAVGLERQPLMRH
jgi:hypothetical protein